MVARRNGLYACALDSITGQKVFGSKTEELHMNLNLGEQATAIATQICEAALNAVAQLASAVPQLAPLWDAISGVITEICAAVGVA